MARRYLMYRISVSELVYAWRRRDARREGSRCVARPRFYDPGHSVAVREQQKRGCITPAHDGPHPLRHLQQGCLRGGEVELCGVPVAVNCEREASVGGYRERDGIVHPVRKLSAYAQVPGVEAHAVD